MLQAQQLKSNPNLYVFLPILYTVWSDAVLTPSELKSMRMFIEKQDWISADERQFLFRQIDPASPPSPDDLRNWLEEIRKVEPAPGSSLVDIGTKLASLHSKNGAAATLAKAKPVLSIIDETLGLVGREAVFTFYPERRETITSRQATQKTFDVAAMAKILDGKYAAINKKVKTILSDPQF